MVFNQIQRWRDKRSAFGALVAGLPPELRAQVAQELRETLGQYSNEGVGVD